MMAAGCTPEINEAEYQDFSSHFFAALTGRDRVGRAVTGADYNQDRRVSMDEAFACYERACEMHVPTLHTLRFPSHDLLRADPRWAELQRRVGME